ncbi:MAG: GTPase Era [Flavobacteriales bacterium]
MAFKSGFVNIIGKPNAGKSTLMNALLGEKLSIITPKAQTTRHRILGIMNDANYQIVFSDTPGILKPAYKLQEYMLQAVEGSFQDADIFLYVADVSGAKVAEEIPEKAITAGVPLIILLNKIDMLKQEALEAISKAYHDAYPDAEIIPVSALHNFNLDYLLKRILHHLPEGSPYYEQDALSDRSERFFVSEIIREKILLNYQKEIPYSVEVIVEEFKEEPEITRIRAIIYVNRESQKGILIGHQGAKLKKTSTEARKSIEEFLNKHVYLDVQVKVSKDWRDSERQIKRFGY